MRPCHPCTACSPQRENLEEASACAQTLCTQCEAAHRPFKLPAALDVELGEVETRYSTAYEEKVNPFSDFRARERDQRRSKMNVLDKVMFEFGQFISGSW